MLRALESTPTCKGIRGARAARLLVLALWACLACGAAPPEDVLAYEGCSKMNEAVLPKRSDDPHEGRKNVYACNVPCDEVDSRPFPDGALIVKESIKEEQDYPWLIATARKSKGEWQWDEYTRNFASEDFAHILASEEVCIDCHRKWKEADWIATAFDNPALFADDGACAE